MVVVKKINGKWRVYIDLTNLNKACPNDDFPFPNIDMIIDLIVGHKILSLMYVFSGYNQIQMNKEDEIHTAFIFERGISCYKVMPFGLKNLPTINQ